MKHLYYLLLLCILSSCYDPITESGGGKNKSDKSCELQVAVFSQTEDVSYPVAIQIYDTEGSLCREQALTADKPQLKLSLTYGNYRLVALSGTSYYRLPEHLTLESSLTYVKDNLPQRPLLMGQADITLASPTASASMQLDNMTAHVSAIVSDIDSRAKSVKITLSNQYSEISLGGSLENPQQISLTCHREDRLWTAGPYDLLPAQKNNTVVSMEVQLPDTSLFYGYNLPYALQAGGSYQMKLSSTAGVAIDPILPSEQEIVLSALPHTPSMWDGHVVIMTESVSTHEGEIWLLSINEWEDIHSAYNEEDSNEASDIALHYQEGGQISGRIGNWSIPSRDEANQLKSLYAGSNASLLNNVLEENNLPIWSLTDDSGSNVRYLCNDAQHTFTLASSSAGISKAGTKATYRLRLIKKLRVKIGQ